MSKPVIPASVALGLAALVLAAVAGGGTRVLAIEPVPTTIADVRTQPGDLPGETGVRPFQFVKTISLQGAPAFETSETAVVDGLLPAFDLLVIEHLSVRIVHSGHDNTTYSIGVSTRLDQVDVEHEFGDLRRGQIWTYGTFATKLRSEGTLSLVARRRAPFNGSAEYRITVQGYLIPASGPR